MPSIQLFDNRLGGGSRFVHFDKKRLGLYVHIPFCLRKCAYCDFYSFAPKNPAVMERYVNALISHMQSYKGGTKDYNVDTVFFGGGTPTALPEELLLRLIRAVRQNFSLTKGAEFTLEANPATVDTKLLRKMRRAGVNRLCIGLQSANDDELHGLSRIHTREDFEESFRAARRAKIDNINVDLMFGIPYQTKRTLLRTLRYVVHLGPEHISLYDLILEPGTKLYERRDTMPFPTDDEEAEMYLCAVEFLRENGYAQYEVSNFARPGYQCMHNLKYWNCEEYLGLGTSAHSYFRDSRFSFVSNLEKYVKGLEIPASLVKLTDENDIISPRERVGEYIMLRFRLTAGLSDREFARRFGFSFTKEYGGKMEKYIRAGYAAYNDGVYALTPRGMFVSNYILSDVLDFEDLGELSLFSGTK